MHQHNPSPPTKNMRTQDPVSPHDIRQKWHASLSQDLNLQLKPRNEHHAILPLQRPSPWNDFNQIKPSGPHDSKKGETTRDSQGGERCQDPDVLT